MFRNLFNPDSHLMMTMARITDCIFLSLFWIVGCIPVVTAGASFAAMYDATYRALRCHEKNSWLRFFQVFRRNWKAGIVPTLIFGVATFALAKLMILCWNSAVAGSISWMFFAGAMLVAMLMLGMLSVLFPMLSRFENSTGGLLKNTFLLAFANMPRTLGLGVMNGVTIFLCARFVVPIFFLPSLACLLGSLFIEPMFKPYMPEDTAE